jgi:hypothetical protein
MSAALTILGIALPVFASARGAVIDPADLGSARDAIAAKISEARAQDPEMFATVEKIDLWRPEKARHTRGQKSSAVGVVYRRLGPRARFALAELAAFCGPPRTGANDAAWHALQVALIDAIGAAGDPLLAPILRAAFAGPADDIAGAAAIGLGRLGDTELSLLLEHANPGDRRFFAAVQGLGASHKPRAVSVLARLLDGQMDGSAAALVADALAECGSSWAWATGKLGSKADQEAVRRKAAEALVRNYLRLPLDAEAHVSDALRRVGHSSTDRLIDAAWSSASPEDRARLSHLR